MLPAAVEINCDFFCPRSWFWDCEWVSFGGVIEAYYYAEVGGLKSPLKDDSFFCYGGLDVAYFNLAVVPSCSALIF